MREFTKSMFSFSWAMSLFGMQQMTNWMTAQDPSRPRGKATEAFDRVTQATEEQLGDVLKETFKAGDKFQRAMVDMMLGAFMPRQGSGTGMMGMAADAWGQATGCCGQNPWGTAAPGQQDATGWGQNAWRGPGPIQQDAAGWGPMPAPDPPSPGA